MWTRRPAMMQHSPNSILNMEEAISKPPAVPNTGFNIPKTRKEQAADRSERKRAEGGGPLDERCAGELAHPANAFRGFSIPSEDPTTRTVRHS